MFASFHSEGTIPFSSDKLKNCAIGVLICSTISLSSFGGIPSTPGYLLSFIFLILFAIISGVTTHSGRIHTFRQNENPTLHPGENVFDKQWRHSAEPG